ncbi:MAG: DUF711 family protein, partial [Microbacteriaceae bacterium]|nr:DUF711 family protein [Microbacteriaceae bacterium]
MTTTSQHILETIHMLEEERLDIRTVTMGISLLDCIAGDGPSTRRRIYDRITSRAEHLVSTAARIEAELGIPIINKRVSVTPISLVAAASGEQDYLEFARTLDAAAHTVGIDFIGGFSALVEKGSTASDRVLMESIPQALAETELVCSSVNIGSTR